jgi:PPOX class probable F420-dependent enzyme
MHELLAGGVTLEPHGRDREIRNRGVIEATGPAARESSAKIMRVSTLRRRALMLTNPVRQFLDRHVVGHLATASSRAIPHVVPICFAISDSTLYITIDQKPKRNPGAPLQRMRNIAENPSAAVVVDHYDDDWAKLGWGMLRGRAKILPNGAEHDRVQALLRAAVLPIGGDEHRGPARHRCPYPKRDQLGRSDDTTDERVSNPGRAKAQAASPIGAIAWGSIRCSKSM